ncbi:hypothetical protein C8J57DRAFT_1480110 [Mycena rebaudengoi]|nr:hypothetical protein C8J57DRAFT_1480110 [Mycena rebaudengoi]
MRQFLSFLRVLATFGLTTTVLPPAVRLVFQPERVVAETWRETAQLILYNHPMRDLAVVYRYHQCRTSRRCTATSPFSDVDEAPASSASTPSPPAVPVLPPNTCPAWVFVGICPSGSESAPRFPAAHTPPTSVPSPPTAPTSNSRFAIWYESSGLRAWEDRIRMTTLSLFAVLAVAFIVWWSRDIPRWIHAFRHLKGNGGHGPLRRLQLPGEVVVDRLPAHRPPIPMAVGAAPLLHFEVAAIAEVEEGPPAPALAAAPIPVLPIAPPLEHEPEPQTAPAPPALALPGKVEIPAEIEVPMALGLAQPKPEPAPTSRRPILNHACDGDMQPAAEPEPESLLIHAPEERAPIARPTPVPPIVVEVPPTPAPTPAPVAHLAQDVVADEPALKLNTSLQLSPPALPTIADAGLGKIHTSTRPPISTPMPVVNSATNPTTPVKSRRRRRASRAQPKPVLPATPTPSSAVTRAKKAARQPSSAHANQPKSPALPSREPLTLADVLPVELVAKHKPLSPRVPHANIERYEDGFIGTRDLARTVVIRRAKPAPVAGPSSKTPQRPPLPRRRLSMVLEDQQRQLALFGQDGLGTEAERALVRRQVRERVAIERTQLEAVVQDWRIRERAPPVVQADQEHQLGRYGRGGQASAADRSVLERHLQEKVDIENTVAEIPRAALEDVLVHAGKGKGKVFSFYDQHPHYEL